MRDPQVGDVVEGVGHVELPDGPDEDFSFEGTTTLVEPNGVIEFLARTVYKPRRISGHVVMSETATIPAGEVWELDPDVSAHLEFTAGSLIVHGTLRARPSSPGVDHRVSFTGVDESQFVGGGMVPLESDRGLWCIGGGKMDLVGSVRTPWRRATGSLGVGATSVELDGDVMGWLPGDELVVTPTAPTSTANFWTLYDYPRVASVEGRTVHLDRSLTYGHPSYVCADGRVLGAEVLNLTRNVRVEGTATGRAHIFVAPEVDEDGNHGHTTGQQAGSYFGLRWMGPRQPTGETFLPGPTPITKNVLGRYALHFHHCGDGTSGSLIEGLVARDTGPAFVPHLSHGITFRDCIAHDTLMDQPVHQAPFWWDMPTAENPTQDRSNRIRYERCVASLVRTETRGTRLSGFSFGDGDGNACVDCVSVGVRGTADASGASWPDGSHDIWAVSGLVAHNNLRHGMFTWQNNELDHVIGPAVCYHNGGAGLSHGAYFTNYTYRDLVLAGNRGTAQAGPALAQMAVHSTAGGNLALPQVFDHCVLDAAGMPFAAVILKHNPAVPVRATTVFDRCDFAGCTQAALGFVHVGTGTTAERVDIVDCTKPVGVPWVWFAQAMQPGSRVRVIQGGQVVEEWVG